MAIFLGFVVWAYYKKSLDGTGFFKYMIKLFRLGGLKFITKEKNARVIRNIDQATCTFMKDHPKKFWLVFFYCTLTTVFYVFQVYLIMVFLGFSPSVLDVVTVYALTNLACLVPIPGSLGTYEAGGAIVFAAQKMGAGAGLVFSLVMRIGAIIACIPGLAFLPYYGLKVKDTVDLQNRDDFAQ